VAAILAILAVLIASVVVGSLGVRAVRGTGDFLVASRSVGARANATAVAGEYLSAASFLGVAGLVMKIGVGAFWYPIGYTAGYITLLVLVAAPLRRFGGYTVPDFVEGRLGSVRLRRLVAVVAFVICGLYVVPQLKGAGVVLSSVSSIPYPVGVVGTAAVIAGLVAIGGMRSATYLQAFEYAVKIACVAVPAVILLIAVHPAERQAVLHPDGTTFPVTTAVSLPADTSLTVKTATPVVENGRPAVLPPGKTDFPDGASITFPAGAPVPAVTGQAELGGSTWQRPLIDLPGVGHPLFTTWAVLFTLVLGTSGLPHILVRFGTNPTGRDSRRAAVTTVGLVGFFYLFPNIFGLLGRALSPQLYLSGQTDSVVAVLPSISLTSGGGILTALTAAGAFAAFLSTSTGLLLTAGSAIGHDIVRAPKKASRAIGILRIGIVVAALAAAVVALFARDVDISICVGWAFSLATSTITPLLVLGIWTDRLTPAGAAAGTIVGGVLASIGVLVTAFDPPPAGWPAAILAQPAPICLVLAVVTMIVVSARTPRGRGQPAAFAALARMHRADV
jgi:cation/acetate symporter